MKRIINSVFLGSLIVAVCIFTWQQRNLELKNNLPEITSGQTSFSSATISSSVKSKKLTKIPLLKESVFELNPSYMEQLGLLYRHIFDSLDIMNASPEVIRATSLTDLDAATIIQLHQFKRSVESKESAKREKAILWIGLQLKDSKERYYFVQAYFLEEARWNIQMKELHLLMMKEPNDFFLQKVYLDFIAPASSKDILTYMEEIQFLERGPTDEYFHTNSEMMDRFPVSILYTLVDKVDDYHWWAAYPERDAEQALLDIIENKELENRK